MTPRILNYMCSLSQWLLEAQNKFLVRIAIFSYIPSVQVGRQNGFRLFIGIFHKKGHNIIILMSDFEENCLKWKIPYVFHACQARGLGKCSGQRRTRETKVVFFGAGSRTLVSLEYLRVIVVIHIIIIDLFMSNAKYLSIQLVF